MHIYNRVLSAVLLLLVGVAATSASQAGAASANSGQHAASSSGSSAPSSISAATMEALTAGAEKQSLNITEKTPEQALESYMPRFRQKRAQQLAGTEKILEKSDYELRYRLAQALVDEMFRSLRKAQRVLLATNLTAHYPFPTKNETVLSALVTTWEHTSFLSDLILRLPDILHQQIDDHAVRREVIAWALTLCQGSPVYATEGLQLPLRLAQQELNLIPRDPDYINPYAGADELAESPEDVAIRSIFPPTPTPVRAPRLSRAACPALWPTP